MQSQGLNHIQRLFQSRLTTLEHLLKTAQTHWGEDDSFLQKRLIQDMLPFGTQIAFACTQPRSFVLWCNGQPTDVLGPEVLSCDQAFQHISNTQELLSEVSVTDEKLDEMTRVDLGQGLYFELAGHAYVNDFLIPNFYFHLVTAYDILRMAGVPLGKRDYMMHLVPLLQQE